MNPIDSPSFYKIRINFAKDSKPHLPKHYDDRAVRGNSGAI